MPKVQTITTNFSAGEFSPRLRGRSDIEKFNSSAEKLENCVVLRQGGATMRPSMKYIGEVKTSSQQVRLLPFVYSRTDAFVLEFGNVYMRVWQNGLPVETSPGVPYEVATPYTDDMLFAIDYTQGGDTLILFHEDVPVQRVRRFSATNWVIDDAPFAPAAIYEFGHASQTTTITLSAATVGLGRVATASAATFLASDVGRTITCQGGFFTITIFTDTTHVTGNISIAFPSVTLNPFLWRLQGTPQTALTPSAATPLGATITLTLAANGWRVEDAFGSGYVEVNGGLVRITSYTTALAVDGVIERELTGTTAAPADAWVLKNAAWNAYDGYPRTGTLMQQRLWAGGTPAFPLSFWGSRSGLFFDFLPGTADDSAVYKTIESDDNNIITYLLAGWGSLIGLTFGGEFDVRGGIEKPITQLNAQITKRSKWGTAQCRPEESGSNIIFCERGGTALRSITQDLEKGIIAPDISVYSDHLLESGITSMAFEQKPESVIWCVTGDGDLLAMTYNPEQNQVSICSGATDGSVLYAITIPEGSIDATYVLVLRTINGVDKRYIERLDWSINPGQDSRKRVISGVPLDSFPGFDHLEGRTVSVLADNVHVGEVVVTGGSIALPRPATFVSAGIPYIATLRLVAPEIGTGTGTSQAQATSTNRVSVRFLHTIGCTSNLQDLGFLQFDGPLLDVAPTAFTGVKSTTDSGWEEGESVVELVQALPYPWTVLNVVRTITVNAG